MLDIKKKTEQATNPSDMSKRVRRKKLAHIKDTLHKGLGKKVFGGYGEGKSLICDICKEVIYSCTSEIVKGKLINYCSKDKCKEEVSKLKGI
jgi:hypothetical protein